MRNRRIIVAKAGLDGHDRGARVIVRALMDAGFEVIYTGLFQTPEMIVKAAKEEGVSAVGLSILSGAHMRMFRSVRELLDRDGMSDVLLFGGGIVPDADRETLISEGVAEIFTPGSSLDEITRWLESQVGHGEGGARSG